MRTYTLILFISLLIGTKLWAQKISTDPNDPKNEERPELINKFNWMDRNLSVYHPDGGYWDENGNPISLANPFYKRESYQNHFNLFNYDLSLPSNREFDELNFHPKDGWELIHKGNGFEADETTLITDPLINRVGPYFIMYNRYTGTLRVLASFDGIGANDKIVTTIKFKNQSPQAPNLVSNGLFNHFGTTSQPLDQQTSVHEVAEASLAAINRGFNSSDFQMGYDPCTCKNQSELSIEFGTLNSAKMTLEGRLIATSVPLGDSGDSPLLNRDDFLTQVYKDGFEVKGGMLTYKNIDKLIEKHKKPDISPFEKTALEIFKAALNGVAKNLDGKIIDKGAAIVANKIFKNVPFYKEQDKLGLGLVAAGTKLLSAELFPTHSVPNISFIEGEMVLTGTMEDETLFNNGTINLASPGSAGSSNVQWQYYPAYNKPLGIFALLETPSVESDKTTSINTVQDVSGRLDCFEADDTGLYRNYEYTSFRFNSDLSYAFNPMAEVDTEGATILGALEFTRKIKKTNVIRENPEVQVPQHYNLQEMTDAKGGKYYITPFVPIENLQDVVPKIVSKYNYFVGCTTDRGEIEYDIDVKLKLMIEYTSTHSKYKTKKSSIKVFTYPLNRVSGNPSSKFEDLTAITANYDWPTNEVINPSNPLFKVWDQVNIAKNISLDQGYLGQGGKYTIRGHQINLTNGAKIGHGITLKAGLPLQDRPVIRQKNGSYISNFCNTKYRGNTGNISTSGARVSFESNDDQIENKQKLNDLSNNVIIYPNPNSGSFNIRLQTVKRNYNKVEIFSSDAKLLYEENIESTVNNREINVQLPIGYNYLKIHFDEGVVTKRLLIH